MTLRVRRLDARAQLPTRAYPGDAGLDLYALEDAVLGPGERASIRVLLLTTDRSAAYELSPGDRIAQLVLVKVEAPEVEEVDELAVSERGAGGFGSSG